MNQRNDIWEGFVQFTKFLLKLWWWNCIWNIDKLSLETVTFKLVATANNKENSALCLIVDLNVTNPAIFHYIYTLNLAACCGIKVVFSLQWKISAHTLTIKLSPGPTRPSIVVISLNNHFEQFLSKQHIFLHLSFPFLCYHHFWYFSYSNNNNNRDEQQFLHLHCITLTGPYTASRNTRSWVARKKLGFIEREPSSKEARSLGGQGTKRILEIWFVPQRELYCNDGPSVVIVAV